MELNVLTPQEAAYWGIQSVISAGHVAKPRGMDTLEVNNVTINVKHPGVIPFDLPNRGLRPFIGAVEALQLVGQATAPEVTVAGSPPMGNYTDDGIFLGAYGARVYGQLAPVERLLREDPWTRQAVVTIYDGTRDLDRPSRDVPCTLTAQFWIRDARLHARFSMRSNDVYLGMPYDLFQFCALQCAFADALGLQPGGYTHTVGSLHLYDRNREQAEAIWYSGEPPNHETEYTPRWNGSSIAEISSRARRILADHGVPRPTEFEGWLSAAISVGNAKVGESQ